MQCVYVCSDFFFSWLMCLCVLFVKIQHCHSSQYRLNYSQSNTEQSANLDLVINHDFKHMCILTAMAIQFNLHTARFKNAIKKQSIVRLSQQSFD